MTKDSTIDAFIDASPTSYHAVANMAQLLESAGFARQFEADPFDCSPGGHFIIRDGAIIAYRLPDQTGPLAQTRFQIVGAHTDSPTFKLKPSPEHRAAGWAQVGMEIYGGPLLNSWLDRELGLAGRVVLADGRVELVKTPAWLIIPQLAPHLDRSVNQALTLDPQRQLMPVYGLADRQADQLGLLAGVAELIGVAPDSIIAHDLFAYPTCSAGCFGLAGEFLAASRLDNLSSVFPGLQAMAQVQPRPGVIPILACFDHEEVGSMTRSGAQGPFLTDVIERIGLGLGWDEDSRHQVAARSMVVSSDAGHSVNPNHAERHDPDQRPLMGHGPMLKLNASQHYASDAIGEAVWQRVCAQAGVPVQTFVSNNAVSCGTTIGPLTAGRSGLATVDIGLPILAMHSSREMAALSDLDDLQRALTVFLAGDYDFSPAF
ncbi:MAG: M18 family aminopeptidase [Propionibacteriaceae bacterium]|jgi:aspartyl aminopeptidase|nr:M18 family aminopeptidase [Propionibacteriaceae bacterium]